MTSTPLLIQTSNHGPEVEGPVTCANADVLYRHRRHPGSPVRRSTGPRLDDPRSRGAGPVSVTVLDMGEPGSPVTFDGDQFSIVLTNPGDPADPYTLYTRGGYIEGGNIQVKRTYRSSLGQRSPRKYSAGPQRCSDPPKVAFRCLPHWLRTARRLLTRHGSGAAPGRYIFDNRRLDAKRRSRAIVTVYAGTP